jgi:hypothetical protein
MFEKQRPDQDSIVIRCEPGRCPLLGSLCRYHITVVQLVWQEPINRQLQESRVWCVHSTLPCMIASGDEIMTQRASVFAVGKTLLAKRHLAITVCTFCMH